MIRTKANKMETKKATGKKNETRTWFFEKTAVDV